MGTGMSAEDALLHAANRAANELARVCREELKSERHLLFSAYPKDSIDYERVALRLKHLKRQRRRLTDAYEEAVGRAQREAG